MEGLTAGRVFDGDRMVDRPSLLVDDGVIVDVGVAPPADAAVRALGPNVTLVPGFVDCHQHLVFDGRGSLQSQVDPLDDDALRERARGAADRALRGGVTTVRDLGDRGYVTLDVRGDESVAHLLCAGPPLTPHGGHCHYLGGEVDPGPEAMRAAVRERAERGCDLIKIMVTGGALTPAYPVWDNQFSEEELRAAVDEAHRLGLAVAAHCHGTAGIVRALDVGVDSLEHCSFIDPGFVVDPSPELLDRIAASGVVVSATIGSTEGAPPPPDPWPEVRDKSRAAFRRIHEAGGVLVVGSDAGITPAKPHDVTGRAFHDLIGLGLSPVDALRGLTREGARAVGSSAGVLRRGGPADIVALDGDPLSDPSSIDRVVGVWRSGRRVVGAET